MSEVEMSEVEVKSATVTRTERGLVIAGTRVTLYDVMAYFKADWPITLIQHWLNLSETQIKGALAYIAAHRDEVEDEYQTVLEHAQTNRHYWQARNRERLEQVATLPPKPGQEALHAKLRARKAELSMK